MFRRFSHVMLFSADVLGAVGWYRDVLGFEPLFSTEHYASLVHGPTQTRLDLHGAQAGSPHIAHGAQPYFGVADIDKAVAALRERDVKVEDPRSESGSPRFSTFYDRDGNALGLTESR